MRVVRPVVRTVGGVTGRVRDLGRLREVVGILAAHGLGLLVAGVDLPGVKVRASETPTTPDRVKQALEQLGPTFVKLGQVLSTRPDIVPAEYVHALESLQDDVAALPVADIHGQLARSLGDDWRDRVDRFDDTPLATASIAQVHRGNVDGMEVVFKVQRPGASRTIRSDLAILRFLARRAVIEFPELETVNPLGMIEEFEHSLLAELDFELEARNMLRVAHNFGDDPEVRIPEVIDDLSSTHVLCMEFLQGQRIRDALAGGADRDALGRRYLRVAARMLFEHGFFHGDLHPGNLLVMEGGVLGLIDFGMVGRVTEEMKRSVVLIVYALKQGDSATVTRIFFDLAIVTRRVDYREVERQTDALLEKHWSGRSLGDIDVGAYVQDLARVAQRHGARIPAAYTMLFKAIMTTEGLARSLLPNVDPISAAVEELGDVFDDSFRIGQLRRQAFHHMISASVLAKRLPMFITQLMDDVDAQRVQLGVRPVLNEDAERRKDARLDRALVSAGGIAAMVCTAALLASPHTPRGAAVAFAVITVGMGAVSIMWRRR